jgi:preprotein translocase subunit YajC
VLNLLQGKKVVTTGLGVIGEIGKKTYSVLMEDDAEEDAEKEKVLVVIFIHL